MIAGGLIPDAIFLYATMIDGAALGFERQKRLKRGCRGV